MSSMLSIKNLTKTFGNIEAVKNVNFETQKGEIIAILGPNGAGKSTLMNMITGFLAPTCGQILVLGQELSTNALNAKKNIGFLPEGSPLYPDLKVKTFLNYMAELRDLKNKEQKTRVEEVAQIAKIEDILDQKIETLSKGYLRRVGFAQSILSNPPILLLDEPTDGLDPNQKEHMRQLIMQMGQDKSILISTHLLDEAEAIATRIILINKGQIMADGSIEDILRKNNCSTLEQAFKHLTLGR